MTGDEQAKPAVRTDAPSVLARLEADGRITALRTVLRDPDEAVTPLGDSEAAPRAEPAAAQGAVETQRRAGRYEVLGEIGRGGVGIVVKSRDVDLGRDVAMKVLREEHAANQDVVTRFIEEAQIGGQLQHPGIVPVYEMGVSADGRPYFTMKYVKGRTLAQVLSDRPNPAANRRELLGKFETICRTLAYAHARGVVHRDLKPGNVMIGAFGEVQVVDWGLSKVLGQGAPEKRRPPPRPDVSVIATVRGGESSVHSRVGSIIGTPAYMPPEQARGDVDAIDQRSDVFALGAILCEILTGAPPYAGDASRIVERAAGGDVSDAMRRLDECGAPDDVVALAKRCLAPAQAARPSSAGAVASELAGSFAAAEARAYDAQVAAAEATIRAREASKSRRLTVILVAAVLLAVAVGAGGFWWIAATKAARVAEADRDVASRIADAKELVGRAQTSNSPAEWAEAARAADAARSAAEAKDASESARDHARAFADEIRAEGDRVAAETRKQEDDARLFDRIVEVRLESWDLADAVTDARYQAAFGVDPQATTADALAALVRGGRARDLASALDTWADVRTRLGLAADTLRAAARAADPDPTLAQMRDARTEDLVRRAEGADPGAMSILTSIALGDALGDRGRIDEAVRFLAKVQKTYPGDFASNSRYAYWLGRIRPSRPEETLRYAFAALVRRPSSAALWNNLGSVYMERNETDRAREAFDEALRIHPEFAAAHANRARLNYNAFYYAPRTGPAAVAAAVDAVVAEARRAIEIDASCVAAYAVLGDALNAKGDAKGAIEAYARGADARRGSAESHRMHGMALSFEGRVDEAETEFRKAVAKDPDSMLAHWGLGQTLMRRRAYGDAAEQFRLASRREPENLWVLQAWRQSLLADRDTAGALDVCRREVAVARGQVAPWVGFAEALRVTGDRAAEIRAWNTAILLSPSPANYARLDDARLRGGDVDDVMLSRLDQDVQENPRFAAGGWVLALAQAHQRKFRPAVQRLTQVREWRAELRQIGLPEEHVDAIRDCMQRLLDLGSELERLDAGDAPCQTADLPAAALWAQLRLRYARSADLWAEAFASNASLPSNPKARLGFLAAAMATQAGCGIGDGAALDEAGRRRHRDRARKWLEDDLAAWTRVVAEDRTRNRVLAAQLVGTFKTAWPFAGVRSRHAIAKLPADERVLWDAFWDSVERFLTATDRP